MRISRTPCLALGMLLLAAANAAPANAALNTRCGVGLVAGLSVCIEWMMKASEHRRLVGRAQRGDNEAAVKLAQFEDDRHDRAPEGGRKWWLLAAERGECQALRRMRNMAEDNGNRLTAAKWRTRIRWNRCAPVVSGERWYGEIRSSARE